MSAQELTIRNQAFAEVTPQATITNQVAVVNQEQPRVKKRSSRHTLSATSVVSYIGVFLLIITIVAIGYRPAERKTSLASTGQLASTEAALAGAATGSVDQLLATNVGANLADSTDLPVANNVANLSQSLAAESVLAQTDINMISKPLGQSSEDVSAKKQYVTVAGDTVPSVAEKFGISAQTVRWVNNLSSDALEPGRTLTILAKDGILYTVKAGDTVASIASKYGADANIIKIDNDLDISGEPAAGQQLIIANGVLPTDEQPGYVAQRAYSGISYGNYSGAYTGYNSKLAASVGNKYAWGNCTWYAYERRAQLGSSVGSFWGNASTWPYNARQAGFRVDTSPEPGAVMANGGGYGHVAIVESVNPGVSVRISEMNAYRWGGGFNRISSGDIPWSEATSGYYQYIH